MISEKISNIKPVENAYNNVEQKINGILKNLRDTYEEVYTGHPWARSNNLFLLVWHLLWTVAAIVCLVLWDDVCAYLLGYAEAVPEVRDVLLLSNLFFVLKLACMAIMVGNAYSTVKVFFCMRMRKYGKKVSKLEKSLAVVIENFKRTHSLDNIRQEIERKESRPFSETNSWGREIQDIKKNVAGLRDRICTYKMITNIIVAIAVVLIVVHGILYGLRPVMNGGMNFSFGFATFAMLLIVAEAIVVIMMNVGPYIGKFTKPLGIGLSVIYSLVYYLLMSQMTAGVRTPQMLAVLNFNATTARTMPAIFAGATVIGLILVVCFTNLSGELDMLKNGYVVEMAYGGDKNSGKIRVFILGIWYAINVLLLSAAIGAEFDGSLSFVLIYGILWWMVNPLMRPRGSRLYAFWGRKRCVANEIVLFLGCNMQIIANKGTLELSVFGAMFGVVAVSIVVGAIAKAINDRLIL